MPRRPGRIAFVFAGGSALASVQVGMLRPLLATGIRPDLVVGSSAGALNGAATAAHPDSAPDTLERLWTTAAAATCCRCGRRRCCARWPAARPASPPPAVGNR
jgi:NTE family protein